MVGPIIRTPTPEERRDFIPIVEPGRRPKTAEQKFREKLALEKQKAVKAGVPFAWHKAENDFKDKIRDATEKSFRKNGFVDWNEVAMPKLDWAHYVDPKNFELIDEGVESEPANKHHPASESKFKIFKYVRKDADGEVIEEYANTYPVFDKPKSTKVSKK
jgi:hypothetical protein